MRIINKLFGLTFSTTVMLLTGSLAVAQEPNPIVDLEKLSCRRLLVLSDRDQEGAIMFFHGYMSGQNSSLTVNIDILSQVTEQVLNHCIDNPEDTLLSVFEDQSES